MKKTWVTVVSTLLLLVMGIMPALATAGSTGQGDPGGKALEELLKTINQAKAPTSGSIPQPNNPTGWKPDTSSGTGGDTAAPAPTYVPDTGSNSGSGSGSSGSSSSSSSGGVQSLDWFNGGQDLLNSNKNISIYDINAGITWSAKYINGKNHADIIPASQADADKISANKITGSYVRRPVIVTIGGVQYAGSMYAVGHGETSYCKYFTGVMCVHFTGSKTHGSQKVDSDHQSAISEALTY